METVKLKAQIAEGKIRLEFPCALPAGPAEVVVVVQPLQKAPSPPFDTLQGVWAGLMPVDLDLDDELEQMNRAWKERLGNP